MAGGLPYADDFEPAPCRAPREVHLGLPVYEHSTSDVIDARLGTRSEAVRSSEEWTAWGKLDPLYAVATAQGKAKSDSDPWSDNAFFQSGQQAWQLFRRHWQGYGLVRETCLEIGCGAGRLTKWLADDFKFVYAVDISEDMIAYAKRHIMSDNVSFLMTNCLRLPLADSSVDAVFSTHVFQHLDTVGEGITYFQEVYRVLAPGGSVMIHLPVIMWPGGITRKIHARIDRAKSAAGRLRARLRRSAFRYGLRKRPIMRMTYHEADALCASLEKSGFANIEISLLYGAALGHGRHTFVLARRSS